MATFGGGTIKEYRFTRAWGVNPAEASGKAVIDSSDTGVLGLAVGTHVTFAFGALASFDGIIQDVGEAVSADEGVEIDFRILDNRVRLGVGWATVQGAWNLPDDRHFRRIDMPESPDSYSSDSSAPAGSDDISLDAAADAPLAVPAVTVVSSVLDNPLRQSRYKHLLPEHARAGIYTYTDQPLSARHILNSAFGGAWGEYSFSRSYHSSMDEVFPLGVDASSGMALAGLISQVIDQCGVEMKLEGKRTLVFDRKGTGLPPLPDAWTGSRAEAESLNPNPSKVRVLGDPFKVQIHNVELVPDWRAGWEQWIDELAWVRKVGEVFEMPVATKADLAERAAFAREVSVAAFVKKAELPELADYRRSSSVSRMSMPAWTYIQNYVYRSYRIPADRKLGGIPLASLRWSEAMLAAVGIAGEGVETKQVLREVDPELYPGSRVHVIVKGQPLDLIDARSISMFSQRRNRDLRAEWTEWNDVEIDDENWSIRFNAPVFIDGSPSEGKSILLRINAGEGSDSVDISGEVDADSEYLDVVVPNPEFEIQPAAVKIALCVECGQFQQDFGTGARRLSIPQSGLGMELIETSGGVGDGGLAAYFGTPSAGLLPFPDATGLTFREILYADGKGAAAKAAAVAEGAIQRQVVQLSGGFTRYGVAGAELVPTVDRIELVIDSEGLSESIDYTKARPTGAFLAERTLTRLSRSGELFPGAEQTRNEIRQLRLMAAMERRAERTRSSATHRKMADLFSRPVGDESISTIQVYDKNSQAPLRGDPAAPLWKAGDNVWVDDKGYPSRTGKKFLGVLIVTPRSVEGVQSKDLMVATRGIVPMRITGTPDGGSSISADPGAEAGGSAGSRALGTLHHDAAVPAASSGEVLALVRLGSGGGSGGGTVVKIPPLTIAETRPSYIPASADPIPANHKRIWFTWAACQGKMATNWDAYHDCPQGESSPGVPRPDTWFWAKLNFAPGDVLTISTWEIVKGETYDAFINPAWPPGGARPEVHYHPLGRVWADGSTPFNTGGGGLIASKHVADIRNSGQPGIPLITWAIYVQREGY